jgi:hypothetical protein
MYRTLLILLTFCCVTPALAQSPRTQLVGVWAFKRGIGGPCASLIQDLHYYFQSDGRYSTRAKMRTPAGSKDFSYSGTYVATDTSTTAYVDGHTIGPYPYTIRNDVLTISQPEHGCKVELVRED